jgi:hypothetical protein
MSDLRAEVITAWREAAKELGIRFTSPYSLTLKNGNLADCLGLVHYFGRSFGTAIFLDGKTENVAPQDMGEEYHYSLLTDSYAKYDRELFTATLDAWGWVGPETQKPVWYTGKPWA